jgi:heptosyltransferase-2
MSTRAAGDNILAAGDSILGDSILIVGPSWVGDMVMAQTLFKLLATRSPGVAIDVLAPAWAEPVLQRMPEVRRSIVMPVGHGKLLLGQRRLIGKQLCAEGYQQAIVLPNSLKSALIPWFARIATRTGWRGEARYVLLNDRRVLDAERYPLMVQRFAALAFDEGAELPAVLPRPALHIDADNQQRLCHDLGLVAERPMLGLCPGAEFGPSKQWPAEHYASLARYYLERGWQVLLLGSANDQAAASAIRSAIPAELRAHCYPAAGRTHLVDAVDLLALCRAVVSNDSGLMHVAAAVDVPLVAIYGSTSPAFTPPLASRVAVVQRELPCRPCFERECPLQHLDCLVKLMPEQVINALQGVLAQSRG